MYLLNFPFLGDNKGTNNEMAHKEKQAFLCETRRVRYKNGTNQYKFRMQRV